MDTPLHSSTLSQLWVNSTTALWFDLGRSKAMGADPERKAGKMELISHGRQSSMGKNTQTAKLRPTGSRFLAWLITRQSKKKLITENTPKETLNCVNEDIRHTDDPMNVSSESRNAARGKKCGLLTPKNVLSIGAWNVRTMYETGKTAQVVNEMRRYNISILGVSECRWLNNGSISTDTGETILYSGRTDNKHYEGVALVLSKEAKIALLEWQPVDERLIMARFYSKYSKLSVIQCYAPTNEART
ncbi:craniofacial development protein 2-like [Mytilus trossulus]|uniref:craniofacial development protein 2-like n=1 Tax=Mytilus trossulus TaxID=6551 RepID=UPI00300682DE